MAEAQHPASASQSSSSGAIAIIPARLGSTRFPRKVLADATGKPLIQHVVEGAARASTVERVIVATDSREVVDAVARFRGVALLTAREHPNGTSRIGEAVALLRLPVLQVVVNVQGDEPEIEPEVIDACVRALIDTDSDIGTVASPMQNSEDAENPNIVKVVRGIDGRALYFSRAPIPYDRDRSGGDEARPLRHIGVYAYRVGFLRKYAALPETALERVERLEQLRALEHGYRISVAIQESRHSGVDTPEQYEAFVERWKARGG